LPNILTESDEEKKGSASVKKHAVDLLASFLDGFKAVLKKRGSNSRTYLVLTMFSFLGVMFTHYGFSQWYMYMRLKLNFAMEDFTLWMGVAGIFNLIGNYIFVPVLTKKFKFHDSTIALIGK
jgi:hypothetical protein